MTFTSMNNRIKIIAIYILVVLPMMVLTACAAHFADYRLACLISSITLIMSYIAMIKIRIPPYCQQYFIAMPCSKPKMIFHRALFALRQPYSIAFVGIPLIAIFTAPLPVIHKIIAALLWLAHCAAITAACVFFENLYSNKANAMRGALQYLFYVAIICPPLIANSRGTDEFLLFSPLWWGLSIIAVTAAIIAYPFAKRWVF